MMIYPYELINGGEGLNVLFDSLAKKSSGILLCDKGQENEIPLELSSRFKVIKIKSRED